MHSTLGVAVYSAAAKRDRALRYAPGHSPFTNSERRASVGEWASTPRQFSTSARRRSVSPLLGQSATPLRPCVLWPELLSLTSILGVYATPAAVHEGDDLGFLRRAC